MARQQLVPHNGYLIEPYEDINSSAGTRYLYRYWISVGGSVVRSAKGYATKEKAVGACEWFVNQFKLWCDYMTENTVFKDFDTGEVSANHPSRTES